MSATTRPCEVCNQPIHPDRLEAVPATRLCIEHAREIQRHGCEFKVMVKRERTSKASSLKINYGSVSISKTRNHGALAKLRAAFQEVQDGKQG